ncbi:MAG: glycosyltransferase family 1 protein [Humibacillus sp.]
MSHQQSLPSQPPLRVLAIPSAHPYPERLRSTSPETSRVVHLDDPTVPGSPAGQWWPPAALDAGWVERHGAEVDVVHLHFGFDAATTEQLRDWVRTLRAEGVALVLTVHDLVNPHFADQAEHRARLDVLVPAADAVITLTVGAAAEVQQRWGVIAEVLAHPHVVPLEVISAARDDHEQIVALSAAVTGQGRPAAALDDDDGPFVVGIDLKSLRANVVAEPVVRVVADAVATLPHAELVVDVHHDVLDPTHPRHDAALVRSLTTLQEQGLLRVDLHERRTNDGLWAHLRSLDLVVLPYAFGTHSGWVEACHDLGTTVLAPRTGHWVEQQPMLTFGWPAGEDPDAEQVTTAVQLAFRDRPRWAAEPAGRAEQQAALSERHEHLYAALTAPAAIHPVAAVATAASTSDQMPEAVGPDEQCPMASVRW